ncbi:response regulator transcription factor [Pseudidiomarina terrestris]|uniref:Response regulator transcription factor n=1 Tax=Pseudidiomarina terrestris TaxID=2820060 RepID=A0AAW7R207_9GAMM|nr:MULTISPECIES: response regulator transcription factor [unclassified Pseudidiomarina]MDN7125304.1 response regulator transcription factor [Pseudidiomarina sp. 1APP75-32.1]MDN7127908.1 response regulator transcription factor [Pseudidiomarina sp. 1APR75-33.1]MDN7130063.1 response regulator transcription factor [Pseudidiomarina sp. 1APR75-15]MDN7135568.1 response regulator transcription factor [Pseudidiomarina sp. 1ASP75-5]MDN7137394.1 response regulator transcription factor [Pseudidiomarina sp
MIRLILADDHTMVRQAIAATLTAQGNVDVVAQCADGLELVDAVLRQQADVVLMDISMPKMNGFTALEKILHHRPQTRVIALSMHDEPEYIEAIRLAGACGYVFKDAATDQLLQAIERVMQGKQCFPDVASDGESRATPTQPLANLTRREKEVFHLVVAGRSNKEVAQLLAMSAKTAENHRGRLFKKLHVKNTVELIHFAAKHGLLEA